MGAASLMDSKKVTISQKRQFTIPTKFFKALGFGSEAECILRGNELIIRPIKEQCSGEFSEQILADLIKQGLQGEELLAAFKSEQANARKAINNMLDDAKGVAEGEGEYSTYDDIFSSRD